MKTVILFFTLLTSLLYAEPSAGDSQVVFEGESFTQEHQSMYGISNNYALVVAEHHIYADRCLFFYYGTKIGLVVEDYASDNGFGPEPEQYGLLYKADAGVNYKLGTHYALQGLINLEGSHTVNDLDKQTESSVHLSYRYSF